MCRLEERVLWWIYYDGTKVELILTVGVTLLSNVESPNLQIQNSSSRPKLPTASMKTSRLQDVLGS
jgi:hypothetical protein